MILAVALPGPLLDVVGALLDVAGAAALFLGLSLATIGLYGLLRKPDIFHQLHPAGLITGPAVILVLLAALTTGSVEIITSAILVVGFILVTSSVSGHAIAQAAYVATERRRARGEPPLDREGRYELERSDGS